jgi:hypothetical protein
VIEALRQEAAKGNPAAAREYRAWLSVFGVQEASDTDLDIVSLEDMTPAQRAFARAYLERRIARAEKRYVGLYREQLRERAASAVAAHAGTLAPKNGTPAVGLRPWAP